MSDRKEEETGLTNQAAVAAKINDDIIEVGAVSSGITVQEAPVVDTTIPVTEKGEVITDTSTLTPPSNEELDGVRVLPLTRGRVVYYVAGNDDAELHGQGPMTAHITENYGNRTVNLLVAHPMLGGWYRRNNVRFRQPDDAIDDGSYAEWMPHQVKLS